MPQAHGSDNMLEPDQTFVVPHPHKTRPDGTHAPLCYEVVEPLGAEVLKVVSTRKPHDLEWVLKSSRGPRPEVSPLEDLMSDIFDGSKPRGISALAGSTWEVRMNVVEDRAARVGAEEEG